MKEFTKTTNEMLDYLIRKLVKGDEVYIDLITSEVSTSYICLDNIEDKKERRAEAHRLLDCLRDKPLYVFGESIEYDKLMAELYDLPIGRKVTFVQIGEPETGDFAQTFYPMVVRV
jgi:hypothetical protein